MSLEDKLLERRSERHFPDDWAGFEAELITTETDTGMTRGLGTLNQYDLVLKLAVRNKCNSVEWQHGVRENAVHMLFDGVYSDIIPLLRLALGQAHSRDREGAVASIMAALELTLPKVIK